MVTSTAFATCLGWSVSPGMHWSVSPGMGGQLAPEWSGHIHQNLQFRTPWVHPEYRHNLQRLKELGLLEIEQPLDKNNEISFCGEGGIRTLDTL